MGSLYKVLNKTMFQTILQYIYFTIISLILGSSLAVFIGLYQGKDMREFFFSRYGGGLSILFKAEDFKGFSKKLNLILLKLFEWAVLGILLYIAKPNAAEKLFILAVAVLSFSYYITHPAKQQP